MLRVKGSVIIITVWITTIITVFTTIKENSHHKITRNGSPITI